MFSVILLFNNKSILFVSVLVSSCQRFYLVAAGTRGPSSDVAFSIVSRAHVSSTGFLFRFKRVYRSFVWIYILH